MLWLSFYCFFYGGALASWPWLLVWYCVLCSVSLSGSLFRCALPGLCFALPGLFIAWLWPGSGLVLAWFLVMVLAWFWPGSGWLRLGSGLVLAWLPVMVPAWFWMAPAWFRLGSGVVPAWLRLGSWSWLRLGSWSWLRPGSGLVHMPDTKNN